MGIVGIANKEQSPDSYNDRLQSSFFIFITDRENIRFQF